MTDSAGQIILFIDELHTVVGAGKTDGAMDAGQLLKPALARGDLKCIGATTLDEYRKYIEKDAALERRFQSVSVPEPSADDALTILRGIKDKYEVHHGVRITDEAIVAAVKLSQRYITSRFLPDKAIDLMDEAASKLSIEAGSVPVAIDEYEREIRQLNVEKESLKKEDSHQERLEEIDQLLQGLEEKNRNLRLKWDEEKSRIDELKKAKLKIEAINHDMEKAERTGDLERVAEFKYGLLPQAELHLKELNEQMTGSKGRILKEEVSSQEIAEVVAKWTGVPVEKMLESDSDRLLHMEDFLRRRVVGQDKALETVADAVRRARSGIADPNQPIGSFLFLGPTGVGKTETVKALAEFLFDDEQSIVRIDMSEYMEKHSVSRLIGAPPGYVGHEEGGQLTEAVRRKPYSVVLLDEIEKAHKDVFNILLQVLDDGRLTDSQGRIVNFKNTVVIMTSNVGSEILMENSSEKMEALLGQYFRPEFLNRLDEIIYFNPLGEGQIFNIVEIQLESVKQRLSEKKIKLSFDDSAMKLLAQRGYDPQYGARPLKRLVQNEILNPLAKRLIAGQLSEGSELKVSANDLSFEFQTIS